MTRTERREDEGYVPFRGHRTWYRRVTPEAPAHLPVILIHGGPGSASGALGALEVLADHGFPTVRYDQLGCGHSDRPDDPDLWWPETFYEELQVVQEHLGLDRVHLLGHSWGGMLSMVHAADHPDHVAGVILSSAPASVPRIARETREMVAQLPEEVQEAIERHEVAGTTDDPEYERSVHEFNRRHICRLDPYPAVLQDREAHGKQVYATICGPSEFTIIGRVKGWDFMPRLHEIRQPTLVTGGRYDEFTPGHAEEMVERLPNGRYVCFEDSAHYTFLEEPDRFIEVVVDFLTEVEEREPTR